MRILIIQDHLRIGGTERQSLFLAKAFQEEGNESAILLFRPGGHLFNKENLAGLDIKTLQAFDSKVSLWAPRLKKTVRCIAPEVILCMGRTANCYAGYLQNSFPDTPVVGTLRTGKRVFPLHTWSLSRVRAVLVNSFWWKTRLLKTSLPEEKIQVVYNALLQDLPLAEQKSAELAKRAELNIAPDECVFLNVATFRSGKRQIDLLRTFSRLQKAQPELKWHLWLMGDGPEYGKCKRWAKANDMDSKVLFLGYQEDPSPFYAAADVAISASREDSLPNFLIEAQASGLPVVAYDCRGVKETCLPGKTGIILDAGDEPGLMKAIAQFASDKEMLKSYSVGAPVFAKERFSRNSQVEQTLSILKNLVNPHD